jgi:hypothetical protein
MLLPSIRGTIRRRILVNFRVDPEVMQRALPEPFTPKLLDGQAVAGICLIRLEHIRPSPIPFQLGLWSENAAHRVAVRWRDDGGVEQEGVYIPRRDTNSPLVLVSGGRLFPGQHHRATFSVKDDGARVDLAMKSDDGLAEVRLLARSASGLPAGSRFTTLTDASCFFEQGSLGYSATPGSDRLEGLELRTNSWHVEPLEIESVFSSYFADESRFPGGAVEFDCALIMRDIPHQWRSAPELYSVTSPSGSR